MIPVRPLLCRAAVLAPLVLLVLAVSVHDAFARPSIRRAFFNVYTGAVGSRLDNLPSHATHCGVCHYDFNGAGPKNPYGDAVAGTSKDEAGIQSIQNLDSDGDGYTNLAEITDLASYSNTPTFIEHDAACRLECVPATKQIAYYSDMYKLEFALPKFAMYKRILAKILAEKFVIDRAWSEERALALGKQVLRGNVESIFNIGAAFTARA